MVKEERYFAPIRIDVQGGGPAGDQSSRDGGVVPNHKVPGEIVPRVGLTRRFPGELFETRRLAGGEDYGYFASNAGGRRFDSCHGNYARVAQWIEHLCPWSLFPRPMNLRERMSKFVRLFVG